MSSTFSVLTFDCANAAELAQFWASVLGKSVDAEANAEFASIGMAGTTPPAWMFIQVPEGKTAKNRVHVDLSTADLDGEVERILKLGAVQLAEVKEDGSRWFTLADPEGNEFDVAATS